MRSLIEAWVPLSLAVLACLSCHEGGYRGEGSFVDRGPTSSSSRYVLDLGVVVVNSTEPPKREYRLAGLPPEEFVVGLQSQNGPPDRIREDATRFGTQVRVALARTTGEVVFEKSGQLSEWTWTQSRDVDSGGFCYGRGQEREVLLDDEAYNLERIGQGTDSGWGTYFRAHPDEEYRLAIEIVDGESLFEEHMIRLVVKGGGWK